MKPRLGSTGTGAPSRDDSEPPQVPAACTTTSAVHLTPIGQQRHHGSTPVGPQPVDLDAAAVPRPEPSGRPEQAGRGPDRLDLLIPGVERTTGQSCRKVRLVTRQPIRGDRVNPHPGRALAFGEGRQSFDRIPIGRHHQAALVLQFQIFGAEIRAEPSPQPG